MYQILLQWLERNLLFHFASCEPLNTRNLILAGLRWIRSKTQRNDTLYVHLMLFGSTLLCKFVLNYIWNHNHKAIIYNGLCKITSWLCLLHKACPTRHRAPDSKYRRIRCYLIIYTMNKVLCLHNIFAIFNRRSSEFE